MKKYMFLLAGVAMLTAPVLTAEMAFAHQGTDALRSGTELASNPASLGKADDLQQLARRKARVPGGSGCDSARDRAEHPECRVSSLITIDGVQEITRESNDLQQLARRKARVPGGSGCDSARDRAEHPECRVSSLITIDGVQEITRESNDLQQIARRKARVPGGSGCDSARDRAEHPECRV